MSSGGMEWAYRMIAQHVLDALGCAIVLHLGWRDHPDFRTDRGIARALGKDRASVRRATAKLVRAGVIERRAQQWVACDTVRIVEGKPDAMRPAQEVQDDAQDCAGATGPRGLQAPGGDRPPGVGATGPRQRGPEAPPKRKENMRRGARDENDAQSAAPPRSPQGSGGAAQRLETGAGAQPLTPWQLTCLREGKPLLVAGELVKPGSQAAERLKAWALEDA